MYEHDLTYHPDPSSLSTAIAFGSGLVAMVGDMTVNTWIALAGFSWSVAVWYMGRNEDKRVRVRDHEIKRLRALLEKANHGQKADAAEA